MSSLDLLSAFVGKQGEELLDGVKDDLLDVIEEAAGMDGLRHPDGSLNLVRAVQLLVDVAASDEADIDADTLKAAFVGKVQVRLDATKEEAITQVKAWVASLKNDLLAKLPEDVRPLVQTMEELEGGHSWPLKVATGTSVELSKGIGLDLAASASAQLALRSYPVAKMDMKPAAIESAYGHLLQIGLLGRLDARLSAEKFFGGGSASVSAGGESQINFDYYFAHRSQRLLIAALLNDLRSLASPFDLDDVATAGTRQLAQIRMGVSGEIQVGAKLTASQAFVGAIGDIGGKSLPVKADVSLGFSGELSRSGHYQLNITPTNDGWVRVGVRYADVRAGKAGIEFNAGLTVSDIDKIIAPFLEEKLPQVEPILELLEELSNPGAWIRDQLGDVMGVADAEGLRKQLLVAFLDEDEKVSTAVGDAIEDAINLSDIDWAGDADNESKKALAALTMRLPVSAGLAADIRDYLELQVNEAIGQYIGAIENKVKTQGKEKIGKLRELLTFFDVPEDKFDDILSDLDNRASELFGPVREVVGKYQSLRSKIISAVESTSSISMKLAIGKLWAKIDSERGALEFNLKVGSKEAQQVYRAILHGDLTRAITAARAEKAWIKVVSAELTEYLSESNSTYLKFSIMDGAFTSQNFARSEISITRDISGNIIAFAGKMSSKTVKTAFNRQKKAAFLNDLSLAARANVPGQRLLNTASVTLSFADEDLEPGEIDEYLDSGRQAGLISQRVVDDIRGMYNAIRAADGDDETGASIELAMNLPPGEMFEVIGQSPGLLRRTAIEALWDQLPRDSVWNDAKAIARSMGEGRGATNLLACTERTWSYPTVKSQLLKRMKDIPALKQIAQKDLRHDLRRLAHLVHHANAFTSAMLKLGRLSELDPGDEDLKAKINRLQYGAANDLKPWLESNAIELLWNNRIPRRNLALIQVLAELAGETEPLVGIVSAMDDKGVRNDIVLDDF